MLRLAIVVLAACAGGCFHAQVDFHAQEIHVRRNVVDESIDLLLIYRGVCAPDDSEEMSIAALRAIEAMVARKRYHVFLGWPFEFDWDGDVMESSMRALLEERARTAPTEHERAEAIALRESFGALAVVDAGLYREDDDTLGVWQHVRHPSTGELLDALNALVRRHVLESVDPSAAGDAAFHAALQAKARRKESWIRLDARGLEVSFPTTPQVSALLIRDLSGGDMFTETLDELDIRDGQAYLAWRYDGDGTLAFRGKIEQRGSNAARAFAKRLLARGVELSELPSLRDARKKLPR